VTCKLCGEERPLIDAHIIPASFFRDAQLGPEVLQVLSNDPRQYPRRAPQGVYDQELVCESCERKFGPWDGYAAELLINRRDTAFRPLVIEGQIASAQVVDPYDFERLRMFVISLLWRAAASSHPFFQRITLPARIQRLRDLVRAEDVGLQSEFRAIVTRWERDPAWPESGIIANPFEYSSSEGPRTVRIYLGAFALDVQVDAMPPVPQLEAMRMAPGRPLYAVTRSLRGSNDLSALAPGIMNWAALRDRRRT
jgi:hypothetical protein